MKIPRENRTHERQIPRTRSRRQIYRFFPQTNWNAQDKKLFATFGCFESNFSSFASVLFADKHTNNVQHCLWMFFSVFVCVCACDSFLDTRPLHVLPPKIWIYSSRDITKATLSSHWHSHTNTEAGWEIERTAWESSKVAFSGWRPVPVISVKHFECSCRSLLCVRSTLLHISPPSLRSPAYAIATPHTSRPAFGKQIYLPLFSCVRKNFE